MSPPVAGFKTRKTLLRLDHLAVEYFSNDNEVVAITFTEAPNRSLEGLGYAGEFLSRKPLDIVAFKTSIPNYFQDLSRELVAESVYPHIGKYRRRISYGTSMGGFGACVFANALKLDLAICMSARMPADASLIAGDTRIRLDADADSVGHNTVFLLVFDPLDPRDKKFAGLLARLLGSRQQQLMCVKVPFSGHPTTHYLSEGGVLKTFVEHALNFRFDEIFQLVRQRTRWGRTKGYFERLSTACLRRNKPKSALRVIEHAISVNSKVAHFHKLRSVLLYRLGRVDEAIDAAGEAVWLAPKNLHLRAYLSHLLSNKADH